MTNPEDLPYLVCEWAYKYRSMGWNVIPLYDFKKAPIETDWKKYETQVVTDKEINQWFNDPPANLTGTALITGRISGVMAIDEDLYASPENSFHLDSGMVSQTASGGKHKIFKDNPDVDKKGLIKIELKNLGSIIVLPPSVVIKKHPLLFLPILGNIGKRQNLLSIVIGWIGKDFRKQHQALGMKNSSGLRHIFGTKFFSDECQRKLHGQCI
ncbi:bifunctional DNA primase/polymerase [Candidatus Microgenomates bacterium]|nr:bifunctional DNA primase/polymerase [Candidatus Microgenomates bacterium]